VEKVGIKTLLALQSILKASPAQVALKIGVGKIRHEKHGKM
jgi:hypothetical protein